MRDDTTMCADYACTKRNKCDRFTRKPSTRQAYAVFGERQRGPKCDYFIPNKVEDKKK